MIRRETYETTISTMLDLFEEFVAEAETDPKKWDEEYAEAAVSDCLDRLLCAGPFRLPNDHPLVERFRELHARAAPFLSEDVPLPGSLESRTLESAKNLYGERWPEGEPWDDLRLDDPIRVAIWMEAERDVAAE